MMLTKYTKPFFRSVGNKYRPRRQCLFLCNANLQSLHFNNNNNNNNNHLYNNKRYLHFVSKEFLIDDVTIPLVDKISNEITKIKSNDTLIFDNKNKHLVAFFFATDQTDEDIKKILALLNDNFNIVIGNDNINLCNSRNIKQDDLNVTNTKNSGVEASLMIGSFDDKCSLLTFSSEEDGMPPECLQLFSDRLKIDKEQYENSLNMLFFSTPSYDMNTVLGPINGLMPEASKVGNISYNRIFLGNDIHYNGFAGLSIEGNVAMDIITTQPYANSFRLENASIHDGNFFSLSTNPELRQWLSYIPDYDRILFPEVDGINGPGREYQWVTEYDEEKGEIAPNFAKFEFSGDIVDDAEDESVVLLQEDPMFMARNICVTLQEYVDKNLLSSVSNNDQEDHGSGNHVDENGYTNNIAGMMMFSSYHGNHYYGHDDFEMNSWNELVNNHIVNVNNNDNNTKIPLPSIGSYCKQGIGPSNEDGDTNVFDEATTYTIFRELNDNNDLPSQYSFCNLTTNGVMEFNKLYGKTVYSAQKFSNEENGSIFAPLEDKDGMEALPVFKWGAGQLYFPGMKQEFLCFEPRNRFLVAYCIANNTEFVMHFADEDLCMIHRIYEYTDLNGDYKIKTKVTGRCYLHGKPVYAPGMFGLTHSYCKEVNDCELETPIHRSDVYELSAKIRKLLVNCMLLTQLEEANLKEYVTERDAMIANLEEVLDKGGLIYDEDMLEDNMELDGDDDEDEGDGSGTGGGDRTIINNINRKMALNHSNIFNDENEIILATLEKFNNGYIDILRKFPDPPVSSLKKDDPNDDNDDDKKFFTDSKMLEDFTFDLISATNQCMYIIFRDDLINRPMTLESLKKKFEKWIKMENGKNRLVEIDVFINELNDKVEEALTGFQEKV